MSLLTAQLDADGPTIRVLVGVSGPRMQALKAAAQPVPELIVVRALVDTGASCTAVDSGVIQRLGLVPTGTIGISTPSTGGTPHQCTQYDAGIGILLDPPSLHVMLTMPVLGTSFAGQTIQALIGRDILGQGILVYNGRSGQFVLAF